MIKSTDRGSRARAQQTVRGNAIGRPPLATDSWLTRASINLSLSCLDTYYPITPLFFLV